MHRAADDGAVGRGRAPRSGASSRCRMSPINSRASAACADLRAGEAAVPEIGLQRLDEAALVRGLPVSPDRFGPGGDAVFPHRARRRFGVEIEVSIGRCRTCRARWRSAPAARRRRRSPSQARCWWCRSRCRARAGSGSEVSWEEKIVFDVPLPTTPQRRRFAQSAIAGAQHRTSSTSTRCTAT